MSVEDFEKALETTPQGSIQYKLLNGDALRSGLLPQAQRKVIFSPSSGSALSASRSIMKKYERAKDQNELGTWVLSSTVNFVRGTLVYATAISPPGPMAVGAALVSFAADLGLNKLVGMAKEETEKSARKKLAMHLAEYSKTHDLSELKKEPDGQKRLEIIKGKIDATQNQDFREAPDEVKGIVNSTLVAMLADATENAIDEMVAMGNQLKEQGQDIKELESQVVKNERVLVEFSEKTDLRFKRVESSIKVISDELMSVNKRINFNSRSIQKNREDIDYLQASIFGKMDPTEQVAALKSGFFPDMSAEDRRELTGKIHAAEKRAELVQDISDFAHGAQELLTIADNFGIKVDPSIRSTVEAGTHLVNAGLAFASGNYLGALSSVSKLFGGKKKDIGSARHKQVMRALGQLAQGQKQIMANQGKLLKWSELLARGQQQLMEGQKALFEKMDWIEKKIDQVLENQRSLYKAIRQVSDQLERHHQKMLEEMAKLLHHIAINRSFIISLIMKDLPNIQDAKRSLLEHSGFKPNLNRFVSYVDFQSYANGSKDYLKDGLPVLLDWIPLAGTQTDSVFRLDGVQEAYPEVVRLIDHYKALWGFVKTRLSKPDLFSSSYLEKGLASLIAPTRTVEGLVKKIAHFESVESTQDLLPQHVYDHLENRHGTPISVPALLDKLYSVDSVKQVIDYVPYFHYMFFFFNRFPGDPLYSMEELRELPSIDARSQVGYNLLRQSMVRVDVAIAQQSLLSGDAALELFYRIFKTNGQGEAAADYTTVVDLLSQNGILARNFVLYGLRKEVAPNFLRYHSAIRHPNDSTSLKRLTSSEWGFKWDQAKRSFYVEFNEVKVHLPDSLDLKEGIFITLPELSELFTLRARLSKEILGYTFDEALSQEERKTYMRALLVKN